MFFSKLARRIYAIYVNFYCHNMLKNVVVGKGDRFIGKPVIKIHPSAKVSIGDKFVCRSSPLYTSGNFCCSKIDVRQSAILKIGNQVGITDSVIMCHKKVVIGNYVNVGNGTIIMDTNFHSLDWRIRENRSLDVINAKRAPIDIGDYVFIGARSIICKGVSIGEKTIIAAGSVVVNDIPSGVIAGGNPCRVIKTIV